MKARRATNVDPPRSPGQATFTRVYDENVDTVYRYVYRRCRDHALAEDITQETFTSAVRQGDPQRISTGWLITVARNRLIDILRRQARYEVKLQLVANEPDVENDIDIADRLRVETALAELPLHYRLVLTLHYVNGMTVRAIATELDRSPKSVEGLVSRARRELIALLEDDDGRGTEGGLP